MSQESSRIVLTTRSQFLKEKETKKICTVSRDIWRDESRIVESQLRELLQFFLAMKYNFPEITDAIQSTILMRPMEEVKNSLSEICTGSRLKRSLEDRAMSTLIEWEWMDKWRISSTETRHP